MPNIRLTLAYDGTCYGGWQIQDNTKTIQAEIEKALKRILGGRIKLVAAGRTDSGVHAKAQVANFKRDIEIPLNKLQSALNANLPDDIAVIDIKKVSCGFHSQFDAKSKVYRYTILNSHIHDPFLKPYYHKVPCKLNTALMKKEAGALLGRHDFKSFQANSALSPIKDAKRTIKKIAIKKKNNLIFIDIEADGFLHNMVRNITGTLIEIGRGHFPPGSMKKILNSKNRRKAGPTAPAKGLTLLSVKY